MGSPHCSARPQSAAAKTQCPCGKSTPPRSRASAPQDLPCLRPKPFMLVQSMAEKRPLHHRVLTLHDWEAKHYVVAAVIILLAMGMFAYSWS